MVREEKERVERCAAIAREVSSNALQSVRSVGGSCCCCCLPACWLAGGNKGTQKREISAAFPLC